jgi:hypothetical protein
MTPVVSSGLFSILQHFKELARTLLSGLLKIKGFNPRSSCFLFFRFPFLANRDAKVSEVFLFASGERNIFLIFSASAALVWGFYPLASLPVFNFQSAVCVDWECKYLPFFLPNNTHPQKKSSFSLTP